MVLVLNLLLVLKSLFCYPAGADFQRLFNELGGVRTGGWFIALGWTGPGASTAQELTSRVGSLCQWLWQEGAEQAECPKFLPWEALSCKLWDLGRKGGRSWVSPCSCHNVLLLPGVSALEQPGAGRSCRWRVQHVCKGQQWAGWAQIPPRLWGLLRAVLSRNGTVSWSK